MSEQGKDMTLEEYVVTMRNQIVITFDGAKEVALKNFDSIAKRYVKLFIEVQDTKAKEKLPSTTGEVKETVKKIVKTVEKQTSNNKQ